MASVDDLRILLVEDDPNDCLLFERAFRRVEVKSPLRIVQSAEEAQKYLKGEEPFANRLEFPLPHLVLMDLKIPRMTGFELLGWIKEQPDLKRLVVIVLSASSRNVDVEQAYGLGANGYLVKPVDSARLMEAIKALGIYWIKFNRFSQFQPLTA